MSKILLVEDDNNLREIYEARLQAEGYTIVSARDGEEALVVAKQEGPDLVISDVMMPKISGFEMLDILRNTEGLKDVKVIMLTALGQTDDQQRASSLGADRYLVKSQVTLEDIVKVAHDLLEGDAGASVVTPTNDTTVAVAPESTAVVPNPSATPAPDSGVIPVPTVASTVTPDPDATVPTSEQPEVPTPLAPSPVAAPAASEKVITPTEQATEAEATTDAESTSQEEAEVEAKIEDFVANAPATTPVAEPTAVAPEPTPSTAPASDPATTADDKLMAHAVDNLSVSPSATEANDTSATDLESAPEPETSDGATIAHKKIIKPIDSEPKQDINELLAKETAQEVAASPAQPVVMGVPAATAATPAASTPAANPINITEPPVDPNKPDPNSIAL